MNSKNIEILIVKYLTNEANSEDLDYLSKWILNSKNERLFESYIKIHYKLRLAMNNPDIEAIKKNLSQQIKKDKNPFYKYKVRSIFKYAALLIIVFGIGYLYQMKTNISEDKVSNNEILTSKEESITIQMDDGTLKVINLNEEKQIKDKKGNIIGSQKKSELSYLKAVTPDKLVYNTLNVPYGKRFDLVLSDGTHVYLNAGTSIKYPIKFITGLPRNVFLTGEAYFDVTKDEKHPFVVNANYMNVKVLGTKFNVSSYSENASINTVLVEGSVEIYGNNKSKKDPTILKSGFKAEWDVSNNEISIDKVDTRIYTAWIEGKLIFRNATFKHIRKTLERQYNVIIKNSNKELDDQLFDATFDIESINEIIESFSKSYAIQYKIINNEVLIY
ncbi:FecR family protein [Mariniflexile sp.]|uniref:FecR family protein n=1 Tax=Mariniflexile sp. TaxID=1979402 RepID=UPI00404874CC